MAPVTDAELEQALRDLAELRETLAEIQAGLARIAAYLGVVHVLNQKEP